MTTREEIRLSVVDGHTIRIEANGQTLLRTFVELGLFDGRKKDVVMSVTAWPLLLLFCKKGVLRPSEYGELGEAYAAKKAIERMGKPMRRAFGLPEHPIREYSRRQGMWLPRFRVANVGGADHVRVVPAKRKRRGSS